MQNWLRPQQRPDLRPWPSLKWSKLQQRLRKSDDGELGMPWGKVLMDEMEGREASSYPSGIQWSMIPPIVRSVSTELLGHAKRAAEPLAVKTQLPSRAPTGSTATSCLPLLF